MGVARPRRAVERLGIGRTHQERSRNTRLFGLSRRSPGKQGFYLVREAPPPSPSIRQHDAVADRQQHVLDALVFLNPVVERIDRAHSGLDATCGWLQPHPRLNADGELITDMVQANSSVEIRETKF
jgi:hypothetical protein